MLASLAAAFDPTDRALLLGHVRDGEPLAAVADRLGLDRRTVAGRGAGLRAELCRAMAVGDGAAAPD